MLSVTRLEAGQRQQPKHPRTREITECETGCSHFVGTLACREWYQHLNGSDSAELGRTEEGREKTWEDRSAGRKVEARQPAEVVRWTGRQSADRELVVKTKACLAVVDASDPTCSRRGSLRGGAWMREGQPKRAASKPGEAGSSQRGVCYSSRRVFAKSKIHDRLTHLDDDATLLLPCILHSPYTFLESSYFLFQTG